MGMEWLAAAGQMLGTGLTNQANARQAKTNRRFQAFMSGTAHQREVADLRAAGLNPILSADGGSGASTPSGSTATFSDVVGPSISTALQVKRLNADLEAIDAGIQKTQSDTNVNEQLMSKMRTEMRQTEANTALTQSQLAGAKNVESFEKDLGKEGTYMKRILEIIRMLRGSTPGR